MTGVEWQKVLYGLVAGWFLAQFTSYVLWRLKARRTKKLLVEELVDLHKQVYRIFFGLQRSLQAFGANVIEPSSTIPVSNPIYQAHYKDAVLHLPSSKRVLYQLIHGHVAKLNEFVLKKDQGNDAVRAEFLEFGESDRLAKLIRDYEWLLRACYGQCWILDWHIKQQLESDDPDLEMGTEKHKAYLDMLAGVTAKVHALIEQGKGMSPMQFEVPYHPDSFASPLKK
jgi:hypothetical protein